MYRSHIHRHSQSRNRTAATPTVTLRMILRTGPLLGPNSIIPGLPEANAACKKEIGPRGRLFSRCEIFSYSELDEPGSDKFYSHALREGCNSLSPTAITTLTGMKGPNVRPDLPAPPTRSSSLPMAPRGRRSTARAATLRRSRPPCGLTAPAACGRPSATRPRFAAPMNARPFWMASYWKRW
jgi:hypothetical protein